MEPHLSVRNAGQTLEVTKACPQNSNAAHDMLERRCHVFKSLLSFLHTLLSISNGKVAFLQSYFKAPCIGWASTAFSRM
eukprot:1063951-Pelagomonas_calceolata.AAC.4